MRKIEPWQLEQRLSLPLDIKIKLSQERIRSFYNSLNGNVYVSIDGKDSNVLLHLVRSIFPNVKAMHVLTGVGFKANTEQLKQLSNIEFMRPKKSFFQVIREGNLPFPTKQQSHFIHQCQTGKSEKLKKRLMTGYMEDGTKTQFCISKKWRWLVNSRFKCSDKCCNILKKEPIKRFEKETGLKPFTGTMVEESNQRKFKYLKDGCNVFEGSYIHSTPIAFWTEQDVLEYTLRYNLNLSKAYGNIIRNEDGNLEVTGYKRTGCAGCPYGVHLEKYPNRYQIMSVKDPELYDLYINKCEIGEVLRESGINVDPMERLEEPTEQATSIPLNTKVLSILEVFI
ncbi:MAG: phosphoadenosine phosphosulfate reductase family protein [Candidatus Hodarchaeota archaeon]